MPVAWLSLLLKDPKCRLALLSEEGTDGKGQGGLALGLSSAQCPATVWHSDNIFTHEGD